ncbi:hypothetical protein [Clostridium sp. SM-530-WT-3G]|nr:hypothetical protein [Clostridium sp. SM-530-WT-3G]NME82568.1 hypothetical protein [Clostridium sp. SM-530-WT-3G]
MKILAYSHRDDETEFFKKFSKEYNVEISIKSCIAFMNDEDNPWQVI